MPFGPVMRQTDAATVEPTSATRYSFGTGNAQLRAQGTGGISTAGDLSVGAYAAAPGDTKFLVRSGAADLASGIAVQDNTGAEYLQIGRNLSQGIIRADQSGSADLIMRGNESRLQPGGSNEIRASSGALGFHNTAPLAQQAKPASPTADIAQLKTAVDDIITKVGNLGLWA